MKLPSTIARCLGLALLPVAALTAQTTTPPIGPTDTGAGTFTPTAGTREFTLGGAGGSNTDFDDSFGGVNFSVGQFFNERWEGVVRQSITYTNPGNGGTSWNGSTRVAADYHLNPIGIINPYVGANLGYIYGETVNDTFIAGAEIGAKYYVQPRTFIYATLEYAWLFDDSDNADDTFEDGSLLWSVGIGFNF